jgi:hypothetical protein
MSTYYEIRIDVVLDLSKDKELLNYLEESKRYTDYKNKDKVPFEFEFNSECIKYQDKYCVDTLYNQFVDKDDVDFILDTTDITKVKLQCYTGNKNRDDNLDRVCDILYKHSIGKPIIILYDEYDYWLRKLCEPDDKHYEWEAIIDVLRDEPDLYNGFYDNGPYVLDILFNSYEFHKSDIEVYKKVNILEES